MVPTYRWFPAARILHVANIENGLSVVTLDKK